MKRATAGLLFCLFIANAMGQTGTPNNIPAINVPAFASAEVKKFYQSYADHLLKCILAIREKNETKAIALFKNPGEQLVAREKIISKEVVKTPLEKQKYIQFAEQVYPYLKEIAHSEYYIKIYGK